MKGEFFTERCRRLLNQNPHQSEFVLTRQGLESLLLDSERYGEQNKRETEACIKSQLPSLVDQFSDLCWKYPGAVLGPLEKDRHLLYVPDIELPKDVWNTDKVSIYVYVPENFPLDQPHRFLTHKSLRLKDGRVPSNILYSDTDRPDLIWWDWQVDEVRVTNTLLQYVNSMKRRFSVFR